MRCSPVLLATAASLMLLPTALLAFRAPVPPPASSSSPSSSSLASHTRRGAGWHRGSNSGSIGSTGGGRVGGGRGRFFGVDGSALRRFAAGDEGQGEGGEAAEGGGGGQEGGEEQGGLAERVGSFFQDPENRKDTQL